MKKLILFLDDDERCSGFAPFLERDGHLVIRAVSADDALSLLMEGIRIDLLITEQFLPGTNVMEFLRFIHRIKPGLPVMVIQAAPLPSDRLLPGSAGAIEYICRPFAVMEALHKVNRLLCRTDIGAAPPAGHGETQDCASAL